MFYKKQELINSIILHSDDAHDEMSAQRVINDMISHGMDIEDVYDYWVNNSPVH